MSPDSTPSQDSSNYTLFDGVFQWFPDLGLGNPNGVYGNPVFSYDSYGAMSSLCSYWALNYYDICLESLLLGPRDAIVTPMRTPPGAEYFGMQTLVWMRDLDFAPLAPVADAHNLGTLVTTSAYSHTVPSGMDPSYAPSNASFVLVTAFDAQTAADVTAALTEAGVPSDAINLDVLPDYVGWYNFSDPTPWDDPSFDLMQVLGRVNGVSSDAGAAYTNTSFPSYLLRGDPSLDGVEPIPYPGRRARGTNGTDTEAYLADALAQLQAAVTGALESEGLHLTATMPLEVYLPNDLECLSNVSYYPAVPNVPAVNITGMPGCDRFTNDALYTMTPETLTSDVAHLVDGRQLVVVGVNHNATGKAMHVNLMLSCINGTLDLTSPYETFETPDHSFYLDSDDMQGSAAGWVDAAAAEAAGATTTGEGDDFSKLFAWRFARSCPANKTYSSSCTDVSEEAIPAEETLWWVYRAYLERSTANGALPDETLRATVLLFDPET